MNARARLVPAARVALAGALVAALFASLGGCAHLQVVTGPSWGYVALEEPTVSFRDLRDREELTVLVFGDFGDGSTTQHRVAHAMRVACEAAGGCDVALVAGDNLYPAGARPRRRGAVDPRFIERFELPYLRVGELEYWLVAGNHDWYGDGSISEELRYSQESERWRMPAVDYPVPGLPEWFTVYALDSTSIRAGRDLSQIDRALESLCYAPGWRVLLIHAPPYSSGFHTDRHGVDRKLRGPLEPLLRSCDLDWVLAGHEHFQEHLKAGTTDVVIQGAAAKLRRIRDKRERPEGVTSVFAASRPGFAILRATPDAATVEFFDADAVLAGDLTPIHTVARTPSDRPRADPPPARWPVRRR